MHLSDTALLFADGATRWRDVHRRRPRPAPDAHYSCTASALAETGNWCCVSF